GIVNARQQLALPPAGPFKPPVTGHRQQAIPVRSFRGQTSGRPSDVPSHVGVNEVQCWRAPVVDGSGELGESLGPHITHGAVIWGHAGFEPGRAYRKSTALFLADPDDGAMPGKCELG